MSVTSRRRFLALAGSGACGGAILPGAPGVGRARAESPPAAGRMTMNLSCGRIGVSVDQLTAIDLAADFGFGSVDPHPQSFSAGAPDRIASVRAILEKRGLVWAAADLAVDFRGSDAAFDEGMLRLPAFAKTLQALGVDRCGTWLMPGSDELEAGENSARHVRRLGAVADVLGERGVRLGLEYVGTKKLRDSMLHPWVHDMKGTLELIAEIARPNVGLVLDSWHWFHAGETAEDIVALDPARIIAVDINDAPSGTPREEMPDSPRELPCATGVIDLRAFLAALKKTGYDGPVRAEPFLPALSQMPKRKAVERTAEAMKRAFALVEAG